MRPSAAEEPSDELGPRVSVNSYPDNSTEEEINVDDAAHPSTPNGGRGGDTGFGVEQPDNPGYGGSSATSKAQVEGDLWSMNARGEDDVHGGWTNPDDDFVHKSGSVEVGHGNTSLAPDRKGGELCLHDDIGDLKSSGAPSEGAIHNSMDDAEGSLGVVMAENARVRATVAEQQGENAGRHSASEASGSCEELEVLKAQVEAAR